MSPDRGVDAADSLELAVAEVEPDPIEPAHVANADPDVADRELETVILGLGDGREKQGGHEQEQERHRRNVEQPDGRPPGFRRTRWELPTGAPTCRDTSSR